MISVIHYYKCELFDILRFKHLLSSCLTILESSTRASTSAHMSIENTEPQLLSPASQPASRGPTAAPEKTWLMRSGRGDNDEYQVSTSE